MNSLEELNNYSGTTIEFTDRRTPNVIFDRIQGTDQIVEEDEGQTFQVPIGIEILEVINPTEAAATFTVNLTSAPNGTTLTWPALPAGVTTDTPLPNVYKLSGINTAAIWDQIKQPTIGLPNDFNGEFNFTSTINYIRFAEESRYFTTSVTVADVKLLTTPTEFTFTPGQTQSITNTPQIVDAGTVTPTYTVTVTPSNPTPFGSLQSAGAGGTTNFDSVSKVYTIVGTKTQVNSHLATLSITSLPTGEVDFYLTYYATSDLSAETDTKIQNMRCSTLIYLGSIRQTGYYVEDTISDIEGAPLITDASYDGSGSYVYTITPIPSAAVQLITATGSGGSTSFNGTSKVLTITGTRTQVNSYLDNIVLTPATDYAVNFLFSYTVVTPRADASSRVQNILVGSADTEVSNMNISRSYRKNEVSALFSTNVPFISDFDVGNFNDFTLGIDNFTVEMWIRTSDSRAELINFQTQNTNKGWSFFIDANNRLGFSSAGAGGVGINTALSTNNAWSTDNWSHVAAVKQGTTFSLYANGARVYTNANWPNIISPTSTVMRMGFGWAAANNTFSDSLSGATYYTGYMDDVRISNVARYSGSTYTIPGAEFTDDANTMLLMHGANNFQPLSIGDDASTGRDRVTLTPNGVVASSTVFRWPRGGSLYFDSIQNSVVVADLSAINLYTIVLSSGIGEFAQALDGSDASSNWTYIGGRTAIDAVFPMIKFYPNLNVTGNSTFNYKQYKNGVLQVNQDVTLTYAGDGTVSIVGQTLTGGTWTPGYSLLKYYNLNTLLVGGGGGGGAGGNVSVWGGGGGGGVIYQTSLSLNNTPYQITVGAGGLPGQNGGDTIAFGYTAYGGQAGQGRNGGASGNPNSRAGGAGYYNAITDYEAGGGGGGHPNTNSSYTDPDGVNKNQGVTSGVGEAAGFETGFTTLSRLYAGDGGFGADGDTTGGVYGGGGGGAYPYTTAQGGASAGFGEGGGVANYIEPNGEEAGGDGYRASRNVAIKGADGYGQGGGGGYGSRPSGRGGRGLVKIVGNIKT